MRLTGELCCQTIEIKVAAKSDIRKEIRMDILGVPKLMSA